MSLRVLITGGAGFIGSFLVDRLISEGHYVRILDSLEPQVHPGRKSPLYLNSKAELQKGSTMDSNDVKKAIEDIDVVFHLAALVGVGQSMYEIKRYVDANTAGTANMLDVLANSEHQIKKVIVASSMSTYGEGVYTDKSGNRLRPPVRSTKQMSRKDWEVKHPETGEMLNPVGVKEADAQICNSIYAITKKDQEDMVMNVCDAYGIASTALRYFNVFGPRQSLSNPYTGVAAIFMSRIKNNNSPVIFEDGLQSRDFISVHDIVEANILSMKMKAANNEVFNVGSGKKVTILQVAETLASLYGKKIKPDIVGKFRKGDVRHCFSDISKIKSKLDFSPKVSFNDGMKDLIRWAGETDSVDKVDIATKELEERGLLG
ncbi:GDP-mannose 4,6-dehydratase [Candidatus Woesearchaeota archaeon]|nr:GDP-mannose 4,6-dehydratase [Candidatus Woesearchaeota archaeon]